MIPPAKFCYDKLTNLLSILQYIAMSLYDIVQRSVRATVQLSYRPKHGVEKLARYQNHLTFLIRCRDHHFIPNGLRVTLPVKLINQKKLIEIARRTSRALLCALISDVRTRKVQIESEINTYTTQLQGLTSAEQWMQIKDWCTNAEKEAALTTKNRQKKKFDQLRNEHHQNSTLDPKRVINNISRRALTEDEERVLALGLNFAVTPKQIPYRDIIAATESTARQLKTDEVKQLRICVSEALSQARPPSSNLDKRMHRAIRDLRRDTDIVILPADKGNATVVMD